MTLSLRLQHDETGVTRVWLIEGRGITSGLLFGVMPTYRAEELAEATRGLGVEVRVDAVMGIAVEVVAEEQRDLFAEEA